MDVMGEHRFGEIGSDPEESFEVWDFVIVPIFYLPARAMQDQGREQTMSFSLAKSLPYNGPEAKTCAT
jgi:hypothetical protein